MDVRTKPTLPISNFPTPFFSPRSLTREAKTQSYTQVIHSVLHGREGGSRISGAGIGEIEPKGGRSCRYQVQLETTIWSMSGYEPIWTDKVDTYVRCRLSFQATAELDVLTALPSQPNHFGRRGRK